MPENNSNTTVATQPIYTTDRNVVKLTKNGLIKDKEEGLTNPEMAKKYDLTPAAISKALKMVGLTKKRAKARAKFEIVEETV